MAAMSSSPELKRAFNFSLPTLFAYGPLGMVFAILWLEAGFPGYWAPLFSMFVYAGAVQFIALSMMQTHTGVFSIVLAASFVACRNVFYGISLFDRFKPKPKLLKSLLIFGLVDASYAVLTTKPQDPDHDDNAFCFYVTAFPWLYWVGGTVLGWLLYAYLPKIHGLDFMLTSFFTILVVDYFLISRNILSLLMPIAFVGFGFALLPGQYVLIAILLSILFIYQTECRAKKEKQGSA